MWRSEDSFHELALPFYHVSSKDPVQASSLGDRHLQPSHQPAQLLFLECYSWSCCSSSSILAFRVPPLSGPLVVLALCSALIFPASPLVLLMLLMRGKGGVVGSALPISSQDA